MVLETHGDRSPLWKLLFELVFQKTEQEKLIHVLSRFPKRVYSRNFLLLIELTFFFFLGIVEKM